MNWVTRCSFLLLMSVASSAALAGDEVGQTYVTLGADLVDDDTKRGVDDSIGGSLTVGHGFTDRLSLEGFIHANSLDGSAATAQDHLEFGVNGLLHFARPAAVSPYLLFGLSELRQDFDNGNEDNTRAASVGAGLAISPTDRFAIRLQYRLRRELQLDNLDDHVFTAGLQFGFGGSGPRIADSDGDGVGDANDQCPNTPAGAIVGPNGCQLDSDRDGVVDGNDQCPNTPAGVRVDANGCEIQLDSDGDGVTDRSDECPRTPAGATVKANGCEVDTDGDTVVDSQDQCPNTATGVRVDIRGCEIQDVIELPGVNFGSNSDELLGGSERVLLDAAATLAKNSDLVVEVAGHTDSDGAAAYNESLSERRARAVRNFLVENGANAANLTVRGYGESQPIADNGTAAGKAENRRVELRLLNR
ncbi:MAG: OmpA family protein [Pseudomonadota bacterium]